MSSQVSFSPYTPVRTIGLKITRPWRDGTDYKILTTIITTQLIEIIDELISDTQTSCGKNKSIFNNTISIENLLDYLKENNKTCALISWSGDLSLSLLHTVCKLVSGSIATRIKTTLHKLIKIDQTWFVSERFIGENTTLIYDVVQYAEEKYIPGLRLLVDFEKGFDTVSWDFIDKVYEYYNFRIKTFQNNIFSMINQGGHFSDSLRVSIHRGCRQGNPISSDIFIMCGISSHT